MHILTTLNNGKGLSPFRETEYSNFATPLVLRDAFTRLLKPPVVSYHFHASDEQQGSANITRREPIGQDNLYVRHEALKKADIRVGSVGHAEGGA